ncbi:hypothetical protein EVAR_41162_1 [Eumeta japonica]|uniref:Uncharacterized protein n=1 Tax=Eumeta variegata TaxID=151549 RepID=A0A4C1YF21_EUMVA|nr:hypothetical protein EVAR_41162_1 [Eumeta japonica]
MPRYLRKAGLHANASAPNLILSSAIKKKNIPKFAVDRHVCLPVAGPFPVFVCGADPASGVLATWMSKEISPNCAAGGRCLEHDEKDVQLDLDK